MDDEKAFLIYTGYLAGRLDMGGPGQIHPDEKKALEAVHSLIGELFPDTGIVDFYETCFGFWREIERRFPDLQVMSPADRLVLEKHHKEQEHKCPSVHPDFEDVWSSEFCRCCGFFIYMADGPSPMIELDDGWFCLLCAPQRKDRNHEQQT